MFGSFDEEIICLSFARATGSLGRRPHRLREFRDSRMGRPHIRHAEPLAHLMNGQVANVIGAP